MSTLFSGRNSVRRKYVCRKNVPVPSQQHAGLQHTDLQPLQEVNRPKYGAL